MPGSALATIGLAAVGLVAGLVDAIAGGGGLLTLPALLAATPDPRLALGTNKTQSAFGALSALASFHRAGRVDPARLAPGLAASLAGSLVGVHLVLALRPERLRPVVLALLVGVALSFALRGRRRPEEGAHPGWAIARRRPAVAAGVIGLVMGTYDGFFGPGTGMFLIALFVAVFGDDLTEATANAKVGNFASNVGAIAVYAWNGHVDLRLALPMGIAQAVGAAIGARLALRGGERLVRAGVLTVSTALVVRLAWQMLR